MSLAAVVVAPDEIVDTAVAWARRGLVAPSLWVRSSSLGAIDLDSPNSIRAVQLEFDHEPRQGSLALLLAGLESLDEARFVWIRHSSDTDTEQLALHAELLLTLLPHTASHWIDVVVPQRRTDEAVAPLASSWIQFRIDPTDRAAPDVSDAGWDRELAVPLHAALALGGLLGGVTDKLPWATQSAAEYRVARVFSRLVDGGMEVRREAQRFVTETLPRAQAVDLHEEDFLRADAARATLILDRAVGWLMEHSDGALAYRPPSPAQFAPEPRVTVLAHLRQFMGFVPFGLEAMAGVQQRDDAEAGHVLEFEDLGYHIGPEVAVAPAENPVPDFGAMEDQAVAQAEELLAELGSREGAPAPTSVWEPLCRLATSLVDGGAVAPDGWEAESLHERRLTLPVNRVELTDDATTTSASVPELQATYPLSVASASLTEAARERGAAITLPHSGSQVVASAIGLAHTANDTDRQRLREQLAELGTLEALPRPASLLDRVHGAVLGGVIRSRLDAERWAESATRRPQGDAPVWAPSVRLFRWVVVGLLVLLSGVGAAWWLGSDDINRTLGTSLSLTQGLVILAAVAATSLPLALYLFFRSWLRFMERGHRRLELLAMWLGLAARARLRHAAQRNTERVMRAWAELLTAIPSTDESPAAPIPEGEAEKSPLSMKIGHPQVPAPVMREWLADAGGDPGWRWRSLQSVAAKFSGVPPARAVNWLAEDQALPGGRLADLLDKVDALQADVRLTEIRDLTQKVMATLVKQVDTVRVERHPELAPQETGAEPLMQEITPANDEDDWPDDDRHSFVISSRQFPSEFHPFLGCSDALCAGNIRIQVKRSAETAPEDSVDGGEEPPHPRAEWR